MHLCVYTFTISGPVSVVSFVNYINQLLLKFERDRVEKLQLLLYRLSLVSFSAYNYHSGHLKLGSMAWSPLYPLSFRGGRSGASSAGINPYT